MKYLKFIPLILAPAFLVYYYFGVYKNQTPTLQTVEVLGWEAKTDDRPPVSITVKPTEFGKDAITWKFDVVFDTHSESLDQDPTQVTVLVDDKGNVYQPSAWLGSGPGGHHREGTIVFNPIQPLPTYVELKIKKVGGIAERSFRWDIK